MSHIPLPTIRLSENGTILSPTRSRNTKDALCRVISRHTLQMALAAPLAPIGCPSAQKNDRYMMNRALYQNMSNKEFQGMMTAIMVANKVLQ